MDFITELPRSKGYDSIFVVVDLLTKMAHLFPVHKDASAKDIGHVFMKGVLFITASLEGSYQIEILSSHPNFGGLSLKPRGHSYPSVRPTIHSQMARLSG